MRGTGTSRWTQVTKRVGCRKTEHIHCVDCLWVFQICQEWPYQVMLWYVLHTIGMFTSLILSSPGFEIWGDGG